MGTTFAAKAMDARTETGHSVIIPRVRGRAYLTGFYQLVLDHDDPFPGVSGSATRRGTSVDPGYGDPALKPLWPPST